MAWESPEGCESGHYMATRWLHRRAQATIAACSRLQPEMQVTCYHGTNIGMKRAAVPTPPGGPPRLYLALRRSEAGSALPEPSGQLIDARPTVASMTLRRSSRSAASWERPLLDHDPNQQPSMRRLIEAIPEGGARTPIDVLAGGRRSMSPRRRITPFKGEHRRLWQSVRHDRVAPRCGRPTPGSRSIALLHVAIVYHAFITQTGTSGHVGARTRWPTASSTTPYDRVSPTIRDLKYGVGLMIT